MSAHYGLTVIELQKALLDLPSHHDYTPTRDAIVQFTLDGDTFYSVDQFIDYGDGGVVIQLMPFPPEVDKMHREALRLWGDPRWRQEFAEELLNAARDELGGSGGE